LNGGFGAVNCGGLLDARAFDEGDVTVEGQDRENVHSLPSASAHSALDKMKIVSPEQRPNVFAHYYL
jgi:hypothetical protein